MLKVTFRDVPASGESMGNFSSSIGLERGAAVVRAEAIVVVEPVAFALDSPSRTAAIHCNRCCLVSRSC